MDRRKVASPLLVATLLMAFQVGCGSTNDPKPKVDDMYYGVLDKSIVKEIVGNDVGIKVEKRNVSETTATWVLRDSETATTLIRVNGIRTTETDEGILRAESDELHAMTLRQGAKEVKSPQLAELGYGHMSTMGELGGRGYNKLSYQADVIVPNYEVSITLVPVAAGADSAPDDVVTLLKSAIKNLPEVMPTAAATSSQVSPRSENEAAVVASRQFLASRLG